MIPRECKRLAEVDFPIAEVSRRCVNEGSLRHGHPKSLHLWWARRPLGACRSVLLALLLPDPADSHCPGPFKERAREILRVHGSVGSADLDLRRALLRFIGSSADWELANNNAWMTDARALVRAAYADPPLVVDPFSGAGSIPLEALRLGCEAFASDLNPVSWVLLHAVLHDAQNCGPELVDEIGRRGAEISKRAAETLAPYYRRDPDRSQPITYFWARTIRCEAPNCGAEIPLIRSFWLCKKGARPRALRPVRSQSYDPARPVEFEIFSPSSARDLPAPSVSRARARCLIPTCQAVVPAPRVRDQLREQRGGAKTLFSANGERVGGARLLAVAVLREGVPGRSYRLPVPADYQAVHDAEQAARRLLGEKLPNGISWLPDEDIPRTELRRISLPIYGIERFSDMFTWRQLLALSTYAQLLRSGEGSASAARVLALCLDKTAELNNAHARWEPNAECPRSAIPRRDIPMSWDFAEACPLTEGSGSFSNAVDGMGGAVRATSCSPRTTATIERSDACAHPLPNESAAVWFTDPPYADSVPYAHLSDFFYVWLRRSLPQLVARTDLPRLAPKDQECVVDRPHRLVPEAKTAAHYEARLAEAMGHGLRVTTDDGIGCIVFAHKSTEGWEALLSGIIRSGWVVTASWPIETELSSRMSARDTASLTASVHLVCRPRPRGEEIVGDWADVLRELPIRVAEWMTRLEREGVRGADLVFACIGPALEIYSRYTSVETPEGREVQLPEFLERVWEVVGRSALEHTLGAGESRGRSDGAGVLEEDSRLTALFLWTLRSTGGTAAVTATESGTADDAEDGENGDDEESDDEDQGADAGKPKGGYALIYDVARRFAQPLGIRLEDWEGRVIETTKGVVRLLSISERAKALFGEDGVGTAADQIETLKGKAREAALNLQFAFMSEPETSPTTKAPTRGKKKAGAAKTSDRMRARRDATTLDRVHGAMILQASGRTNALRTLLQAEKERGPSFARLASRLSVLYPTGSEEKRLLEAMLLAMPK